MFEELEWDYRIFKIVFKSGLKQNDISSTKTKYETPLFVSNVRNFISFKSNLTQFLREKYRKEKCWLLTRNRFPSTNLPTKQNGQKGDETNE